MPSFFSRWLTGGLLLAAALGMLAAATSADTPPVVKLSAVAPLDDLQQQIATLVDNAGDSLANRADFNADRKEELQRIGNVLIVLAQAVALHDTDSPAKKSMGDLLKAAKSLAEASEFDPAAAALADAKKALAGSAGTPAPTQWESDADLGAVMKNVGTIFAGMRRSTAGPRLKKDAKKTSGQTATLAVIAQISTAYTDQYAEGKAGADWKKFCAQMRDAAGEANGAIHAADAEKTSKALERLNKSCETCHEVFHKDEKK